MFLYEEYFERKDIPVKVVPHVNGAILLKDASGQWKGRVLRELDAVWTLTNYLPRYNAYSSYSSITDVFGVQRFEFDIANIQDAVLDTIWIDGSHFKPVPKAMLAAELWKIFLYVRDGWLAEHMPREFFSLIPKTFNSDGTLNESARSAANSLLPVDMRDSFQHEGSFYSVISENYADWWVKLYE